MRAVVGPIQRFFRLEAASGILLGKLIGIFTFTVAVVRGGLAAILLATPELAPPSTLDAAPASSSPAAPTRP